MRMLWTGCGIACALMVVIVVPASADVKLVMETGTVNAPNDTGKLNYTIYIKGKYARRENPDGTVTLIDLESKRMFTFNPIAKTYYQQGLKEADVRSEDLPDGLRPDISVKLQSDKSTATLAAKGAEGLSLTEQNVLAKLAFKASMMSGSSFPGGGASGGGFPGGGGGFPGGGGGGGGRGGGFPGGGGGPSGGRPSGGMTATKMPGTKMDGWIITTDAATFGIDKKTRDLIEIFISPMMPPGAPFNSKLADALGKTLALPLSSHLTVDTSMPEGSGGRNSARSVPARKVTVELKVTEIDLKATLDDTLFELPKGFTRTDPPIRDMPKMSGAPDRALPDKLPDDSP